MRIILFSYIILIFSCCSGSYCGDEITGKYKTIIFIQPSAADYPVNLHEEGGYVEFILLPDSAFEAKFFIPALPEHQLEENESDYKGRYSVNDDTLKISGTNTFLDNEVFIFKDDKLEMKNRLRRGPMDLVFKKVKE